MKIGEDAFFEDGRLVHKKTFDAEPAVNEAKRLRDAGVDGYSENKLVARVPNWLINEWLKEAGVKHDDPAAPDVIGRKLMSGEADAFRVWQGRF